MVHVGLWLIITTIKHGDLAFDSKTADAAADKNLLKLNWEEKIDRFIIFIYTC